MKNEIFLVTCLLACRSVDGQITNRPDDQEVCKNKDLKIDWAYGDASNFLTVTWTFRNSTSPAATTFMSRTTGASTASVIGDFNAEFNGNGAITLTQVDFSNNGSYKISVTYTSTTLPDDDTVIVTVKDCEGSTSTPTTSTPTSTIPAANTTGSTTSPPNVTDSDGKKIIIGVSVGVVIAVVLAIFIGVCCYFKYKNKERKQEHSENKVSYSNNQGQDVQHGRFSNKSYETENRL